MALQITDIKPKNKKKDKEQSTEKPNNGIEIDSSSDDKKGFDEKPRIIKIRDYILDTYNFRFNEVRCQNESHKRGTDDYIAMTDRIYSDLVIELKTLKFSKPKEDLDDILKSSLIKIYNPMKEYFENLEFKGTGYINQLSDCIQLDELHLDLPHSYRSYFRDYFKKWLIASYFCSIGTNVNDMMFILIGPQGKFKTSFLNYLTPPALKEYLVTQHIIPSLTDYNTSSFLCEKFFINVDDQMEQIMGKDYNSMKAIISTTDVSMRRKYGKMHERRKRIATFCGSVNNPQFLRDSSNRRYLCFQITDISKQYSKVDIDNVWAEVVHEASKMGTSYVFGRNDYKLIEKLNEHFSSPTLEEESLKSVFLPTIIEDENTYFLQFSEILKVLRYNTGDNNLKIYNLQTAMRKHGFESKSKKLERFNNSPRHIYQVCLLSKEQSIKNMLDIFKTDLQSNLF
jgi:predicted P-loop ATPase